MFFLQDVCDFFSGRRSGHVGTWRYSEPLFDGDKVNGMYHWAEFVKKARDGSAYYVVNDELNVIQKTAPKIQSLISEKMTIIDMGPGSKEAVLEKVGPFIKTGYVSSYVGVDIVKECLDRTDKVITDAFPAISYIGINRDFYDAPLAFPVSGDPVMVMFGQTLFNLPIDPFNASLAKAKMLERLMKFRLHLGYHGYLVITQDCNQDSQSLYEAYMTEEDFDLNLLYRIQRDLPVSASFQPEKFSFEPFLVETTGAASHTYVCNENMDFTIGDESFVLSKGQRFYMHNTYKFDVQSFLELTKKSYFSHVHTEMSDSGRVALHVLKAA